MKMTDTIQMLDELLQAHEQLLTKLERRLTKLPAGSLYIKRQNGKEYYLRRIAYNGKRLQILFISRQANQVRRRNINILRTREECV